MRYCKLSVLMKMENENGSTHFFILPQLAYALFACYIALYVSKTSCHQVKMNITLCIILVLMVTTSCFILGVIKNSVLAFFSSIT